MGKIKMRRMLKTAFAEFGAEMRRDRDGAFVVRYKSVEYLISLDETDEIFCLIQMVKGPNGLLSPSEFGTMMSVVKEFYPECDGNWNGGYSYIESKLYSIWDEHGECSSARLEKIIKDFFETWTFACANASLASQQ